MKTEFEKTLVVLPARGGSKRIPNKNIKVIYGQPMIYWPLMAINKLFNAKTVLVSTDSEQIKKTVESKGLNVPFMRPNSLSDDYTGTVEVVAHALDWYEKNVCKVDYVLTVYPTAVLLSEKDISAAMKKLLEDRNCDSVLSATNFPYPIQRAVYENSDGYAQMFEPLNFSKRSQDLTEALHDAGQFYLCKADAVRNGAFLTDINVKLQILHRNKVIDIDTIEDFEIAEEMLGLYKNKINVRNWMF